MLTRRELLARGVRGSTLLALAPAIPGFLARTAHAASPERDGRILVVIQLDGGNDGINTVVPFGDDGYARHRVALRLPEPRLIRVGDGVGLHPALGAAGSLLESGRLAIVPGVGYPGSSRSHFRSMAIWQSARLDGTEGDRAGLGWLGRGLDAAPTTRDGAPASLLVGSEDLPAALRGRRTVCGTIDQLADYALTGPRGDHQPADPLAAQDDLGQFLGRSLLNAYTTADRLGLIAAQADRSALYHPSDLARRLDLTARLIRAGLGTRVYYLEQRGYDTHTAQLARHAALLDDLAGSLRAFLDDLASSRLADRVLVLVFSEFGRRVAENGSLGTDHGTAGPVFLASPSVRAGLHGIYPSLTDLEDGDLRMGVDFRRVYATVLEDWLGLPAREALGGDFERLPLIRG